MSEEYDVVLMGSDVKERGTLFSDYPQVLAVFGGADGSKRWERQVLCKQRRMIIGRTIFAEGLDLGERERSQAMVRHYPSAWDLLTGETRMRSNPVTGEAEPWVYGRCGLAHRSVHRQPAMSPASDRELRRHGPLGS